MAKLSFRYGAMGSSKTANALMIKYNFEEKGKKAILLKPRLENRDGATKIKSRIGIESECVFIEDFLRDIDKYNDLDCIIIDESQFMTAEQIDLISDIVDYKDIPVIAFGLRTDFQGNLFEGSKRLLEIADEIQEITTICWCGKKARFNARVINGEVQKTGEQIQLGGNESYTSLCRKHYKLGQLHEYIMTADEAIKAYTKRFGGFPYQLFLSASEDTIVNEVKEALAKNETIKANDKNVDY